MGSTTIFSQSKDEVSTTLKTILKKKPTTYQELSTTLRSFKYDSVAMYQILKQVKTNGYEEGSAFAYNQLGVIYRNTSNYKKAVDYHLKGLQFAENSKNKELQILSLNNAGVAFRRMDAIKSALDYSQKALALAEGEENKSDFTKKSVNIALNGIGNLYQTLEQYDLAIEQFKQAYANEEKLNNLRGLAINAQNIGHCYEEKKELDQALAYYNKSLQFNTTNNSDYGILICNNSIAQIYLKQGQAKKALDLLEQQAKPNIEKADNHIASSVLVNLGWAYLETGQLSKAKDYINQGLTRAKESNIPHMQEIALHKLAELEEKKGIIKHQKHI